MKLLLIEDNIELANSILSYLKNEGYLIETAYDYDKGNEKINIYYYDCIILDLMLPGGSGLDLLNIIKRIRPESGIIIISAKDSLNDKISGLDYGADDYLSKPFHLAELHSRIKSILRRRIAKGIHSFKFNEIELIIDNRETKINNVTIDLTRKEFDILLYLINNKNKVLTKESIAEHVWSDNSDAFDNFDFIYTHMKNLRKKLLDKGCADYIKSIYGIGYKFLSE